MINTTGGAGTNHIFRNGYGNYPINTGDWTILVRYKIDVLPTGYFVIFDLFDGNADYTDPYIYLGAGTGATDVTLESNIGGTQDTTNFTAVLGTQYWAAVTYDSTTHTLTFINNGIIIGSITVNLSSTTWDKLYLLGDPTGSTANALSIGYFRGWSILKSISDLTIEAASITAVNSTGLLWDCPLQASIDLTSHNNTLNQLVTTGTVTTDTTDPLLSVVAGPPTNVDANTATLATIDSAIFQSVVTGGSAIDVYYKYNPSTDAKVASMIGFSSNYSVRITVWKALADVGNLSLAIVRTNTKEGCQFQVDSANTYYIQAEALSTPATATLEFSVLESLQLEVPIGSYAINDDNEVVPNYYALMLLDRTTGYPINSVADFAKGEGAWIFSNGKLLVSNEHVDDTVKLYDSNYNLLQSTVITNMSGGGFQLCRISGSEAQSKYIVVSEDSNNVIRVTIISAAGLVLDTYTVATAGLFLTAIGVLPNFTKLYITISDGANKPVKTLDLVTKAYVSDLDAGVVGYGSCRDIICISTDVILVPYYDSVGAQSLIVRKYDSAGTVLATGNYDAYVTNSSDIQDTRMCRYLDDNSFVLWIKGPANGYSTILRINTVTMAVIEATPILNQYEDGMQFGTITNTPQRFGHSESCPIWTTQVAALSPVVAKSGLYTVSGTGAGADNINPLIRHDQDWIDTSAGTSENVKIPDPFYDIYLVGDE